MNDDNMTGDALAARTFTPTGGQAQADSQAQQDEAAQQAEALEKMTKAMQKGLIVATRIVRALAARKVPEIATEVTDPMLDDWAHAAVPVVGQYVGRLLATVSLSEEGAALVLASVPIALAVVSAIDKHRNTIDAPAREVVDPEQPEPVA